MTYDDTRYFTFSETLVVLPFNNSGAIHGNVPLTPPETSVFRLILDNPKSPTCKSVKASLHAKRLLWALARLGSFGCLTSTGQMGVIKRKLKGEWVERIDSHLVTKHTKYTS